MKTKFGAIIVAGSGKIGGHVASRNRSGSYLRTRVVPVNPQSEHQLTARSLFSASSQAWAGLSDAERLAWNSASSLQVRQNTLGDSVKLSGKALYQSVYINLSLISETVLDSPVAPSAGFAFNSFSAAADTSDQSLILTFAAAIPATHKIILFGTPSMPAGISFVKNQMRSFGVLTSANSSPSTVSGNYIARLGAIGSVGTKIHLSVVAVEISSGISTYAGSCVATVVA